MKKIATGVLCLFLCSAHALEAEFKQALENQFLSLKISYARNKDSSEVLRRITDRPFALYSEFKRDKNTFTHTWRGRSYSCVEMPPSIHKRFPSIHYYTLTCELPSGYVSAVVDVYEIKNKLVTVQSNTWVAAPFENNSGRFSDDITKAEICSQPSKGRQAVCFFGVESAFPSVPVRQVLLHSPEVDASAGGIYQKMLYQSASPKLAATNYHEFVRPSESREALLSFTRRNCRIGKRICGISLP